MRGGLEEGGVWGFGIALGMGGKLSLSSFFLSLHKGLAKREAEKRALFKGGFKKLVDGELKVGRGAAR